MGAYKECREPAKEQQYGKRLFLIPGNPAVIGPSSLRPGGFASPPFDGFAFFSRVKYAHKLIDEQAHLLPEYSID